MRSSAQFWGNYTVESQRRRHHDSFIRLPMVDTWCASSYSKTIFLNCRVNDATTQTRQFIRARAIVSTYRMYSRVPWFWVSKYCAPKPWQLETNLWPYNHCRLIKRKDLLQRRYAISSGLILKYGDLDRFAAPHQVRRFVVWWKEAKEATSVLHFKACPVSRKENIIH